MPTSESSAAARSNAAEAPTSGAASTAEPIEIGRVVLEGVPWSLYLELREIEENHRKRMTYLDGTLVIMSPEYVHEWGSRRIDRIVMALVRALDMEVLGVGMTTLKKPGRRPERGASKEGDQAYYLGANAERLLPKGTDIKPEIDGPPDLAVEVDNKGDSELALPIYARLGVPEVWRFEAIRKTLAFLQLDAETGEYREIDHSLAFPMLTPALVLEALTAGKGLGDARFETWLDDWAAGLA